MGVHKHVGLSEISFNDFTKSTEMMYNDDPLLFSEDSDSDLTSCCIPINKPKRMRTKREINYSNEKIEIQISSDESIEFSIKDLVDISNSPEVHMDSFMKNLHSWIIKLHNVTLDDIKMRIRKQFDEWICEFMYNKTSVTVKMILRFLYMVQLSFA